MLQGFPRADRPCLKDIRAGRSFHLNIFRQLFLLPSCLLYQLLSSIGGFRGAFLSLSMASLHMTRVSAAVWRWFSRCPDVIGPVYDTSSDEEFFTPPTSPPPPEACGPVTTKSPALCITQIHGGGNLLSPSQSARLRRRHAEAVRHLTAPPPVVTPVPHGPLKAYQRPVKVYRPSWAP